MIAPEIPLGPLTIYWYGLCIAVGGSIAYHGLQKDADLLGLSPLKVDSLTLATIAAAIIGGKLLFLVSTNQPIEPYDLISGNGFAILGSVAMSLIAIALLASFWRISPLRLLDTMTSWGILVQSFGRIGCFIAGCCYGIPTKLPWAITYTDQASLAPCGIPLHPVQLYAAAWLFLGFLLLQHLKNASTGKALGLYLIWTSLERIVTSFWRATPPDAASILPPQTILIALLSCGIGMFLLRQASD